MRPAKVIGGWAGLLALWTAVQLLFAPDAIGLALLGGAALAVGVLALALTRPGRPSRPAGDLSFGTVVIALGAAVLASGAELGTWCVALGALIVAFGVAGLLGEARR